MSTDDFDDLPPPSSKALSTAPGDDEIDALTGLLAMAGLSSEPYRSPLLESSFDDGLPPEFKAQDAAQSQRSRQVAKLLAEAAKVDSDFDSAPEGIPLTLDATDLPEEVRRKAGDKFNVEELLKAAKENAAQSESSSREAVQPLDASISSADDTESHSKAEAEQLLSMLQERLKAAESNDDDAAAYAELLASTGFQLQSGAGANSSGADAEAGKKRGRNDALPADWRSQPPEALPKDGASSHKQ